jgi:hypothetical protein
LFLRAYFTGEIPARVFELWEARVNDLMRTAP